MRILAAADIHGCLEVYQWLIEQTPLADVLVLAGDLFDADFEDQQRLRAQKAKTPKMNVVAFKDLIGVSRKYAIPLLQWLDSQRVTRRVGDERVIM